MARKYNRRAKVEEAANAMLRTPEFVVHFLHDILRPKPKLVPLALWTLFLKLMLKPKP